jgi:Transposase DDE domain
LEEYKEKAEAHLVKAEAAVKQVLAREKGPGKRPPDPPEPPSTTPPGGAQHNFTDGDSRIMPDKGGFSQAFNAQASVETQGMLIVGHHTSQNPNDKRELNVAVSNISKGYGKPTAVIADTGYYSERNARECPVEAYLAPGRVEKTSLTRLLEKPTEGPAPKGATAVEKMRHKLNTKEGRALYRLRKMTVEPVFGIIKGAMGFRQFLLRGVEKVRSEWGLVCLAYNLKRMNTLRLQMAA